MIIARSPLRITLGGGAQTFLPIIATMRDSLSPPPSTNTSM